ncbi:hypothetical protein y223_00049 [Bordetella phage PY223]
MAWTIEQLAAVEEAIASGATRVKYVDREVQYNSLSDLLRLRDKMRVELGLADASRNRRYGAFSKGLC